MLNPESIGLLNSAAGITSGGYRSSALSFGMIFSSESDVDLLVEFDPDHIPGLITLAGMEIELSEILGRKADLRTAEDLSPYFRQKVVDTAQVQYVGVKTVYASGICWRRPGKHRHSQKVRLRGSLENDRKLIFALLKAVDSASGKLRVRLPTTPAKVFL